MCQPHERYLVYFKTIILLTLNTLTKIFRHAEYKSARRGARVKEFRYEDKNSEKVEKNSGNGD